MRGKYGTIYPYSKTELVVLITSPILSNRFFFEKKWQRIQHGEQESAFKIPPEGFEDAAQVIRARRRRVVSPESAQRLAQFHFKPKHAPECGEDAKNA